LAQKPAAAQAKNANADQKPKDPAAPSLHAGILEVDAAKQTITVVTGDKANKQEKTLSLAKDVKVLLRDGASKDEPAKEGKLTDLGPGMGATLQLSADEKTVVAITPAPLHVNGGVKAVDVAQKSITIHTKKKTGADEQSYRLTDGAK